MKNANRVTNTFALLLLLMTFGSVPAFAQMDFSGDWQPLNYREHETIDSIPGEYIGLPLNEAGIMRADAWWGSILTLPEWQCRPHSGAYVTRGPSELRIWKEVDPVTRRITAFHREWLRSVDNPVYLDGRPHPSPNAPHTWGGFSTGEWIGDVLKITTTHLKEELIRNNGVPLSDQTTVLEYLFRHGDILTSVLIVTDPVYMTEPLIKSADRQLNLNAQMAPYPCVVVEEQERARGAVPHFLPGQNPDLTEFANAFELPQEAARGGAEKMYPEYQQKLKQLQGAKSSPK